eukprot:12648196-Alexandrium_andersonii.AAC.1
MFHSPTRGTRRFTVAVAEWMVPCIVKTPTPQSLHEIGQPLQFFASVDGVKMDGHSWFCAPADWVKAYYRRIG